MISFYKVTPHSVLFFRDLRPFTAGEQSLARLQFPPRLTPFLGALRTKYLETRARDENKKIKEIFYNYERQVNSISIFWFSLVRDNDPILPAPFDLLAEWKSLPDDRFVTEKDPLNIPILPKDKQKEINELQYISVKNLMRYLEGENLSPNDMISANKLWRFENRVGIMLSLDNKTAERSRFYRITVARLKSGVGFLVGVETADDVSLPNSFTTRLGGEGHIAVWDKVGNDEFKVKESNTNLRFNKAIAIVHIPIKFLDGDTNIDAEIAIRNWCIGKLDNIGGWDYKNNHPKPLLKTLKPGSVLFPQFGESFQCDIYEINFNGARIRVVKDIFAFHKNNHDGKFYLGKISPELGEPNTLLIVKD